MASDGPEAVVPDFPVHPVLPAQIPAEGQFLKGKDSLIADQIRDRSRQENVKIEVEAPQAKNRQVSEEIKALDWVAKAIKNTLVQWRLRRHEA